MRSHGKNIEMVPGLGEIFAIIDEHQELQTTTKNRDLIQQILDL